MEQLGDLNGCTFRSFVNQYIKYQVIKLKNKKSRIQNIEFKQSNRTQHKKIYLWVKVKTINKYHLQVSNLTNQFNVLSFTAPSILTFYGPFLNLKWCNRVVFVESALWMKTSILIFKKFDEK